jgi:hypothetical protein
MAADPDDLAIQQQEDLGSQFSEPAGPHPKFFGGLMSFGENANGDGWDVGPLTPIARGADQGILYGAAALTHYAGKLGDAARENALSEAGLPAEPIDDRPDAEKESTFQRTARGMADIMAPDPLTAGTAFRVLQSISEFVTKMAVGSPAGLPGIIATTAGITHYETYHQLRDQGVDDTTAEHLAQVDAGVSGLFAGIAGPLGNLAKGSAFKLFTDLGAGVGTNVPLGIASRYADHEILENAGYHDLAAQTKPWDRLAILTDIGTGLIPMAATIGHAVLGRAAAVARTALDSPGLARDAADVMNQTKGISNLAPGVPVDSTSAEFHNRAMRAATEQNLSGRAVDMSRADLPDSATFAVRPQTNRDVAHQAFWQQITDAGMGDDLASHDKELSALYDRMFGPKRPEPERPAEEVAFNSWLDKPIDAARDDQAQAYTPNWLDRAVDGWGDELPPHVSTDQVSDARMAPDAVAGDADTTRKSRKWAPPDARRDSLLEYMARHESGLNTAAASSEGIDKADMNLPAARVGIQRAFRKGGISMDHAAETLHEAGYPVANTEGNYDKNVLLDKIDKELRGQKVYSVRNESQFKALEDAHYEAERAKSEEAAREMLADMPDRGDRDHEFMVAWRNAPVEAAQEAGDRWDDASEAERTDILNKLREATNDERTKSAQVEGNGDAPAEVLHLQSESADELQARGARETKAADLKQYAILGAAERARADRELEQPFSLTGSNRASDSDPNQVDLVNMVLADRPNMRFPDANGDMIDAATATEQLAALDEQARAEAGPAFDAAANCFKRGP